MKNLKPTFLLIALGMFLAQQVYAQDVVMNHDASKPIVFESTDIKITPAGSEIIASPDSKLTAKLSSAFPDATGQEWRKIPNGYYVSFLNKNRKARAVFSEKGNMNYAITECLPEQLPQALRSKIVKQYAGYKVVNASEINAYNAVAHQAILENSGGYVTLRATKEGIEEIDNTKKDQ